MINKIKDNYKIVITSILIVLVFLIITVIWIKKSTFGVSDVDGIRIECPLTGKRNTNINCLVYADFNTMMGLQVKASYKLDEDVSYVSFGTDQECVEDCFGLKENNETGFTIEKSVGVSGENLLGTMIFKISDEVDDNQILNIGFTNIEFIDNEDVVHQIEDISTEVRIVSNINTLDNITIDSGELDPVFNKDTLEYRVNVDSKITKINIDAVATDQRAEITGLGEVTLHYGTNQIIIKVISEEGIDKEYKINVYRDYEYTSSSYYYDKDNNYIYTKNDISKEEIIANLDELDDINLSYDIDNNKLIIKYGEEIVKEIDIINIKIDNMIKDRIIYISDLTYSQFIDKLKLSSDKLNIKIVDNDNIEINTDSKIMDDYKMMVYYEDKLLEEYTFKLEYFKIDESIFVIDEVNKLFSRVGLNTKYSEILNKIDSNGKISIIAHDGKEILEDSIVRTGDKIKIELSDETVEYTISVLGDLTGDGTIKVNDVSRLYRYLKGRIELDSWYVAAGDIVGSGGIKVNDVSRLYRYLKKRVSTLEVVA